MTINKNYQQLIEATAPMSDKPVAEENSIDGIRELIEDGKPNRYYFETKLELDGKLITIKFLMFTQDWNDENTKTKAGNIITFVSDKKIGKMLEQDNLVKDNEEDAKNDRNETWREKGDYYEYQSTIEVNREAFTSYISKQIDSIMTTFTKKIKTVKEDLQKLFPDDIAMLIKNENFTEEDTILELNETVKDNKYGPFLFANIWSRIKNKNTFFDIVKPYSTEIAKQYVEQIETTVNSWRKNHFEKIFPPSIALLVLFLFSKENEKSIDPEILKVVKDIKRRYTTDLNSNTVLVKPMKGKKNKDILYLTDDGQQLFLLTIGLVYLKRKELKQKKDSTALLFQQIFENDSIRYRAKDNQPHIKAYELLCYKQEGHFKKKQKEYWIPLAFVEYTYQMEQLTPQSLAFLSVTRIDGRLECNACDDGDDIYYGSSKLTLARKKRDKDGNAFGVCIKSYRKLYEETKALITPEERKNNSSFKNFFLTVEQMKRKYDIFKKNLPPQLFDRTMGHLQFNIDILLRVIGGFYNEKGELESNLKAAAEEIEKNKESYLEKLKNMSFSVSSTIIKYAGKIAGTAGIILNYVISLIFKFPFIYDVMIEYINEQFKKMCTKLAYETLASGDKNLVDIIKTDKAAGKRFNFKTGGWDTMGKEKFESLKKQQKEKAERLNNSISSVTLRVLNYMSNQTTFEKFWIEGTKKDGFIMKGLDSAVKTLEYIIGLISKSANAYATYAWFTGTAFIGTGLATFASTITYVLKNMPRNILLNAIKGYMILLQKDVWQNVIKIRFNLRRARRLYETFLTYWNKYNNCLEDGKLNIIDGKFDEYYGQRYVNGFYNAMYMAPFYALNIIAEQDLTGESIDDLIEKMIIGAQSEVRDGKFYEKRRAMLVGSKEEYQKYTNRIMMTFNSQYEKSNWHHFIITSKLLLGAQLAFSVVGQTVVGGSAFAYFYHALKKFGYGPIYNALQPSVNVTDIVIYKKIDSFEANGTTTTQIGYIKKFFEFFWKNNWEGSKKLISAIGLERFFYYLGKYIVKEEVVTLVITKVIGSNKETRFEGWKNYILNTKDNFGYTVMLDDVLKHKDRNRILFVNRLKELIQRFKAEVPEKQDMFDYVKLHNEIDQREVFNLRVWPKDRNIFNVKVALPFFTQYRNLKYENNQKNRGLRGKNLKEKWMVNLNGNAVSEEDIKQEIKKLRGQKIRYRERYPYTTFSEQKKLDKKIKAIEKRIDALKNIDSMESPPVFESTFEDAEEDLSSDEENALNVFKIVGETRDSKKRRLNKLRKEFEKLNKGYRRKAGLGLFETLNSSYINSIEGRETKEKVEKLRKKINKLKFELTSGKNDEEDEEDDDQVQIIGNRIDLSSTQKKQQLLAIARPLLKF